ncbi:protein DETOXIFICATION 24-like isoform X1 [Mangifera indica]|uniref:protein DETOXIFICATION 24-like isoform X1 n=1 Tax=Mangifera indica TaxID=29780 RepID=UPI001CF9E27B|nr:protein DETOXIFICATION 24-like isoform X1 [Mangifera indica]XP_044481762.1 protein DETOXIFICATION 24-like isoform X1 [Mangifera indica]XP_044481763.1 protein DETOXIFICATION 24-like isoform X1 [Mangifera indica]
MDDGVEERLLVAEENGSSHLKTRIWRETKLIWRIAFPAIITRVTSFGLIVVTQSFLGHVDEIDLAAYALVQSIILRFFDGILLGMSSATETLCGQAFGAGHYHMMGVFLQRSWIVDGVTTTILLPIFIFTKPILKLLGQNEEIAEASGSISLWLIPFVYNFVFGLTIQMFLQAQLKNMVIGWLSSISFPLHVLLSWLFVNKLGLGVGGAMASLNISAWSVVIGEFVYIFGGWCPHSWKGFTTAAFTDIFPVIKLSLSSGVMLCLELWYYSILVLLAGYLKNATVAISAFSICLNVSGLQFMICLGFLTASCVRVSNELGGGNAKAAKFSIKVIIMTSTFFGVLFFVLCLAFGRQLSYLFTTSEEIADAISELSVFLAFSLLLNSIQSVLSGVAVGAGFQGVVAFINLGSYYLIGIPVGCLLGYVLNHGVKGLWVGLLAGVALQIIILSFVVWRTDWDEEANKAFKRINRWLLKPAEESNQSSIGSISESGD